MLGAGAEGESSLVGAALVQVMGLGMVVLQGDEWGSLALINGVVCFILHDGLNASVKSGMIRGDGISYFIAYLISSCQALQYALRIIKKSQYLRRYKLLNILLVHC